MKNLFVLIIAIISLTTIGLAQTPDWQERLSPDKTFSVDLPSSLEKVPFFEAELGVWNAEPFFDARFFVAKQTSNKVVRFAVIELGSKSVRELNKQVRKTRKKRAELLEGLAIMFLADDDESQFLSAPKKVLLNGFEATEYTYAHDDKINSGFGKLYSKGLIFDRQKRTFIIIFVGDDRKDLNSEDANRFFNSFRPSA